MSNSGRLTRRGFLKFAGLNLAGFAFPKMGLELSPPLAWPIISMDRIHPEILSILQLVPRTSIGQDGYLLVEAAKGGYCTLAPQAITQWNRDNSTSADRLLSNVPWGIVLHWYGDKENFDRSVKGYIRGFDSLREVDGELLRTSAHFLVGDAVPLSEGIGSQPMIGILQTQAPDKDGTPFVGSHLRPINYQAHEDRKQYFVRAFYQLGYNDPSHATLLQQIYDGKRMDANQRTIAIEITGYNFDKADHYPGKQKIANTLSLVWALMKRYGIPASSLLGHNEIQLSKADPGKKFMALMRYLVGLKALLEPDDRMKALVFGNFLAQHADPSLAVEKYFQQVRSYLVLVSTPRTTYEWESASKYWFTYDQLASGSALMGVSQEFLSPFKGEISVLGKNFLSPENHEGVDLSHTGGVEDSRQLSIVYLVAEGLCLFTGASDHCRSGQAAIFRHRQPDGAEILSVYSHLRDTDNIHPGRRYPGGYRIGYLDQAEHNAGDFLHWSLAYGASWDIGLKNGPDIPLNAGTNWITRRYLDPLVYLADQQKSFPEIDSPINSKI